MGDDARESETVDDVSFDRIFELLAHRRRRNVLDCLEEHRSLALADIAEEIAREERDKPVAEIQEDDVMRIYLSLWHAHIPKLADAEVIEYDQALDTVRLAPDSDLVDPLLELNRVKGEHRS